MKTDNMMSGGEKRDVDQEEEGVGVECDGEGRAHVGISSLNINHVTRSSLISLYNLPKTLLFSPSPRFLISRTKTRIYTWKPTVSPVLYVQHFNWMKG